ncbi:MAG: coniferyl aldehyde dehydrogenase [Pseudomonadales bacterium]|nr:coniferyl aldehyde dehydrogenase [Pseudomonadales bacterium]MDG2035542.1 coniferyl aldehyde dehydrogenase [Pseudomonadales bacterium]
MNTSETAIVNSEAMTKVLEAQREDYLNEGHVSAKVRIDRMRRGMNAIHKHQDLLIDALNTDFTCRPRELSLLTDIATSILPFKSAIKNVRKWMKPEKRKSLFPLGLLGGRSRIEFQPLGVVGVISPWNFPVNLTFGPMADILAAGNRVMIKPSEFTPTVSEVMADIIGEAWDEKEVAIFTGGPEVGTAFSALPFDHMLFTGATSIAKHIMTAAAKNLVPVTLELGGKSPVLLSRSANIKTAVSRIMLGKTMNAGQICLAPDYLLVPEEKLDEVVSEIKAAVTAMFPTVLNNPEYTSVVNHRHFQRLQQHLTDATEKGGEVISLAPIDEDFNNQPSTRKIPPTIIKHATDDMRLLQDEIFGPLLPIKTYKNFEETIRYVNARPRPLALYYFGSDAKEERDVLDRTTSGGVCLNDVIMHTAQEDLPFGGVGPAGMGAYHGYDGFKNFSHAKSIYKQTKLDVAGIAGIRPPYGPATERTIKMQTKL